MYSTTAQSTFLIHQKLNEYKNRGWYQSLTTNKDIYYVNKKFCVIEDVTWKWNKFKNNSALVVSMLEHEVTVWKRSKVHDLWQQLQLSPFLGGVPISMASFGCLNLNEFHFYSTSGFITLTENWSVVLNFPLAWTQTQK